METIKIGQATKKGYIECVRGGVADFSFPSSKLRRGRVQGGGNISPTLMAVNDCGGIRRVEIEERKEPMLIGKDGTKATNEEISEFAKQYTGKKYRIRKLTPLECYRLMGVSDENAKKMLKVNSNTQCYKQAGNSIVVPVLMALFSQMNIDGVKVWNEMSEDEIYKMIEESQ